MVFLMIFYGFSINLRFSDGFFDDLLWIFNKSDDFLMVFFGRVLSMSVYQGMRCLSSLFLDGFPKVLLEIRRGSQCTF